MRERGAASLTSRLASFASTLAYDDIPPDVVERVRLHLLDTIGCGLAGIGSDLAQRCLAFVQLEAAPGPCPVLGTTVSLGPAAAAFANAAAMNALDFDDGFEVEGKGLGHPGATIVAAALSAVAKTPCDGRNLLAGLAAAYEINARLILAIQPSQARFRQVYGVGQHQSVGAAAAYGRLVGLPPAAMANALGFAGTLTALPSLRKYNWEARPLVSFKDFNAPAAETGVRAVQLTEAGLVGAADVFDGACGFWRMIGSDRFDPALLADGLGEVWWTRHASLKPYPACRWMHTALESFGTVLDSRKLDPERIRRITVRTSQGLARDFMDRAPATMVDRQFSLPHALASLACGRPKTRWHEPPASDDALHRAIVGCVVAEIDPEIDALMSGEARRPAGQVVIDTDYGRLAGPRLTLPLGTRERPISRADTLAKFRDNAAVSLTAAATEGVLDGILGAEAQAGFSVLRDAGSAGYL